MAALYLTVIRAQGAARQRLPWRHYDKKKDDSVGGPWRQYLKRVERNRKGNVMDIGNSTTRELEEKILITGRLASACDLDAQKPDILLWERLNLLHAAEYYRSLQVDLMKSRVKLLDDSEERPPAQPQPIEAEIEDDLSAFTGFVNGILIALPIDALIVWALWHWLRR
jgi:hypothetical protein